MDANTTIDQIFPSRWLKPSDLGSTARVATISKIDFELVGMEKENKAVLSFQNSTKRLILNKTNAQTLANLYGREVLGWVGKKVILFAAEVQFRGTTTLAVRIKEEVPGSPKVENKPPPKAATLEYEPPWPEEDRKTSY